MNSKAKQLWSYLHITLMCMYFIVCALAAQAQVVNDAEYFFDTDPGVGNASPITITTPDDEVTVNLSISTTGLQAGRHLLYIRTRGNTGAWSLYEQRMIEILPTIQAAEYFFDIDPGVGNAIPMMVAASENEIAETEVISTIGLGTGMHFLYIRTRDNQGRWSLQQTRMFEVKTIITDAEYFVDNDPGVGNATPVSIIDSENEIVKTFSVNTTGLASGNHHLYIRSRDENGHWSLQESRLFEVKPRIVSAECFVDIDPGVGSATPIAIIADENEISKSMGVSTTGLAAGKHNLYIRTKDASGRWSLYEPRIFEVKPKIVDAEYFVDTDPGLGSATPISIVDSEDEILKNTIVSTIGLSAGKHILCVRTKDASGHWSLQESRPFEVKPKITDAEYFFDADPGVGYGVAVSVNDAETEITKSVQVPTTCLSQGVHYLYLRTRDNLGHWSLFEPDTLTISGVSVEICGNLLDDDCDGYVDEECSPIVNDTFAGATNVNISGSAYPAGNCFNGSLIGTSVSPQGTSANVAVGGGQDIWYKIIAPSAALRVVASTSSMNIVLELHDALGVQVDMENDDAGIGAEYMNTTGLTEGATYYIAVRSYDGVLGSFSVCVQALMDSHCADGSGTYELCSSFKSSWTGANTYTYNFTPTAPTPGVPTTVSGGGQISLSTIALALRHGGTYDVTIDVTYNLPEGEIITVPGTDVCAITIAPHASVEAKVQQRCPAVLLKGSVLQGKPFVCGAINFTVEFTAVNSCAGTFETGLPFTVNTLGAASNLSLSFTSPQALMNNTYYKVRFRPTFSYGAGNWGLPQIIFIGGSSMNVVDDLNAMLDDEKMDDVMSVSLYPNPNKGELLNTNLTGIESDEVFIRVMDNTGKLIYNNRYVVDGSLNAVVVFEQHLASGLYMVEFIAGEKVFVEKMMVEK